MNLDEILYRKLSREQAEAARDNSQSPSVDTSDMDINELRKFTEFIYAQYKEKEESNDQLTIALMNLNSELYENRKLLTEIRKDQEKTEREKSQLQLQLTEMSNRIAGLMMKMAEKQSEFVNEVTELRRILSDKDAQIAILQTQLYSTKSHKRKNRNEEPGRDDKKDEHDGTQPPQEIEGSGNDQNAEEKEETVNEKGEKKERPYRKGMTYNKGCNETNVIKHYSDKSKLPAGYKLYRTTWQSVYTKVELVIEHKIEMLHYMDAEGNMHTAYIPIENEYADIDSLKGTMLDWDELTRIPERWQGTHASIPLLVDIIYQSSSMSIPFYRKMAAFLEDGYKTCRQTLINWMSKVGGHLKHVLLHLKQQALVKDAIVNCDETWCRVRLKNRKQKKGYIWCMINKAAKIVIFFFDEGSRGRRVLSEFLGDAEIKALQSDAYNAYYYLDNEECGIEHLCCLAHARAKFFQAWKQGKCEDALFYLYKIEALYNLERLYKEQGLTPDQIKVRRNSAETIEIVADIRQRLTQHLEDGNEKSEQFQKALNYLDNYWTQLMAFRNDGRYEIDNSIAERAIRPMTVERKNKVAFGSEKGAVNSCAFHSINETLKLQGKSIKKYYRELLTAVASGRNDYQNLTPAQLG